MLSSYLVIDADDFKKKLLIEAMRDGTYESTIKPQAIKELEADGDQFFPLELASLVHEESSMLAVSMREEALRDGTNIVIDTVLSSPEKAADLGRRLEHFGYEVEVIDVEVPYVLSEERIASRWRGDYLNALETGEGLGGRWVPSEFAREVFNGPDGKSRPEIAAQSLAESAPNVVRFSRYRTECEGAPRALEVDKVRVKPGGPLVDRQAVQVSSAVQASRATRGRSTPGVSSPAAPRPALRRGDPGADRSFVQWASDEITGQVTTYTYDGARRLTGATRAAGTDADNNPIPAVSYIYTYDNRGNRTGQTITTGTGSSATTSTQTRTHNAANQTTNTGFTYDGAGNMTHHPQAGVIAYNAGDQMKSVTRNGVTNDYVYAGTGHTKLLAHEVPGKGTYKYTYGRNNAIGQPVIEQVTVGTATAYLENDASGTPIMLRSSAGMHALYIYDNLGSPAALITTANSTAFTYKFDPYGAPELTEDSGGLGTRQTPFVFTGGLNDRTTGWVLNGARYYDPSEGRWTQHDTLDAPLDPGNANRYAHAANNPVNYIDPMGLWYGSVNASACAFVCLTAGAGYDGDLI